jgi:hypothetical protein
VTEDNNDLHRSLGRLEGKIDFLLTRLTEHFEEDTTNFKALDTRASAIEKKIWTWGGGLSAISILASYWLHK